MNKSQSFLPGQFFLIPLESIHRDDQVLRETVDLDPLGPPLVAVALFGTQIFVLVDELTRRMND